VCSPHKNFQGRGVCRCPEGRVRSFLQPQLMLLLLKKSAHGYEMMERLAQDGETPDTDPGLLYRTLRQLEEDGLVRSSWDTEGRGPARRVYELTDEGLEYLHAWAVNIRKTRQRLDRFLAEYEAYFPSGEGR
jgi:PadR family transcriptional regulator PadR